MTELEWRQGLSRTVRGRSLVLREMDGGGGGGAAAAEQ